MTDILSQCGTGRTPYASDAPAEAPSPYPHCELRDLRFQDRFPPACPLGAANIGRAYDSLQDRAFADLAKFLDADNGAATHTTFASYGTCRSCYDRLRSHSHVAAMRRKLHTLAPRPTQGQREKLQRAISRKQLRGKTVT